MKKVKYFVGMDISCETFTATVLNSEGSEFSNDVDGFKDLLKWFKKQKVSSKNSIIVMESTGVYNDLLCYFLYEKGFTLSVEHPLKIKRAFTNSPIKNDLIDSKQISGYAKRFLDELNIWNPPEAVLEEVRVLLTTREQLVTQMTSFKCSLKAIQKKVVKNELSLETFESLIIELKEKVKLLEKEIKLKLNSNLETKIILDKIISIPGVGILLASNLIVLTNNFRSIKDASKISSYIGICPYEYSSGSSVKKVVKKKHGHSRLKKILYLASMSLSQSNKNFKDYFCRKVLQGKSKKLVLNNIANKLIKIIVGVVKSGKKYIPDYVQISPILA